VRGDAARLLDRGDLRAVLGPEGDAGVDPLGRQEMVAVGVPGQHRFGGLHHQLDDARLDRGVREHAVEPGGVEAVLLLHLVREGTHVRAREVERPGRQGPGREGKGQPWRQMRRFPHRHPTSFLLECSDIRIPKPAIRVTNEVPP
jgi:hypothetical protein